MASEFAERIYARLRQVPVGRVVTYKALAAAAGCGSARAVGQALRANPYAPEVPCHRVIRSDLRIGGFQGQDAGAAVQRKLALLQAEGVAFRDGRLLDKARLFHFG
jgi:methylated-DNA-[protein]-cysteine S-methyltransferase